MRSILIMVAACGAGFLLARRVPLSPLEAAVVVVGKVAATVPPSVAPRVVPPVRPLREEVAKMPAVKRLGRLYDSSDLPRSAQFLLGAIAELGAEDFRALASGKETMPFFDFDKFLSVAFARSFVERWLAVDEKGALAALPELMKKSEGLGAFQTVPLYSALIEARPKDALRIFTAMGPERAVSSAITMAFTKIARDEPAAAHSYLGECRDDAQRKAAELGIAQGIAANDPSSGAALAVQLNDERVFRSALAAAQKKGAGAVLEVVQKGKPEWSQGHTLNTLALQYPDAAWETLAVDATKETPAGYTFPAREAAYALDPAKRLGLLNRSAALPASMRGEIQHLLLQAWATDAPQEAAKWALQNTASAKSEGEAPIQSVFSAWTRTDHDAALAWRDSLPPGATRDSLSDYTRYSNPVTLADGVTPDLPAEAAHRVENKSNDTPWLNETVRKWFAKDAEAAAQWAQSLADPKQKDRAFRAYASAAIGKDAAVAREWVEAIADPTIRQLAAQSIAATLQKQNPAATREWLTALPGVHPLWRQWMLRAGQ